MKSGKERKGGFELCCWQLYLCHSHVSWLETTFHIHPFSQQITHARPLNSLSFLFNSNVLPFYSLFSLFTQKFNHNFCIQFTSHLNFHAIFVSVCGVCGLLSFSIKTFKSNIKCSISKKGLT